MRLVNGSVVDWKARAEYAKQRGHESETARRKLADAMDLISNEAKRRRANGQPDFALEKILESLEVPT